MVIIATIAVSFLLFAFRVSEITTRFTSSPIIPSVPVSCPTHERNITKEDVFAVLQEHIGDYIPVFTVDTLPSHRVRLFY